jgi:hypothetical protein
VSKNDLCKPPNLTQFKNKMIESLKLKETKREKTVENLEREKIPDIKGYLDEKEFEEEIESDEDGKGYYEAKNFQESGKYWK